MVLGNRGIGCQLAKQTQRNHIDQVRSNCKGWSAIRGCLGLVGWEVPRCWHWDQRLTAVWCAISLELRWGFRGSERSPWNETEECLEKLVAEKLLDKGVASQSQKVVSWCWVALGNFLLGQARAQWLACLQETQTCCEGHEVLVQSSYHDQALQISARSIDEEGLVGGFASNLSLGISDSNADEIKNGCLRGSNQSPFH